MRKQALVLYTQWPPAAVAGVRQRYTSPRIWDPAPDVHRILWHAGPDGIEHNRERLHAQMEAAVTRLPVLSDFPEEE